LHSVKKTFNLKIGVKMKLSRRERELLQTIMSLSEKLLTGTGSKTNGARLRRSKADAAELRKQVRAARRQNIPVKEIADRLGITPSYVYQLQR
jgi:DNA-binding CsgD family transcriptional regulator